MAVGFASAWQRGERGLEPGLMRYIFSGTYPSPTGRVVSIFCPKFFSFYQFCRYLILILWIFLHLLLRSVSGSASCVYCSLSVCMHAFSKCPISPQLAPLASVGIYVLDSSSMCCRICNVYHSMICFPDLFRIYLIFVLGIRLFLFLGSELQPRLCMLVLWYEFCFIFLIVFFSFLVPFFHYLYLPKFEISNSSEFMHFFSTSMSLSQNSSGVSVCSVQKSSTQLWYVFPSVVIEPTD